MERLGPAFHEGLSIHNAGPSLTIYNGRGERKVMEGARVRLIDAVAAFLWMLMVWFFVRGGVGELNVMHVWGLAASASATAATVAAYVSCATTKILRRMHDAEIDQLMR